MNINNNNIKA